MKSSILLLTVLLTFGCHSVSSTKTQSQTETEPETTEVDQNMKDSLDLQASDECLRIKEFLVWYKAGIDTLDFGEVEKYENKVVFIDPSEAWGLLNRYRKSGFFTENKLAVDSLYVLKAKYAYETDQTIELHDYFSGDFFLKTQETPQTLDSIPNIYVVPDQSDLGKGVLTFWIGHPGMVCLTFHLKRENGQIKVDQIN